MARRGCPLATPPGGAKAAGLGADTTYTMVGSEFTAPVPFWGRRGYPYGDYQRKWWRALRGLPTFLHCERALRGLLSVPRRAAAGATGAPQEPQDSEDPEPGEHEDPGEPVELGVLGLCPSRSVCHLNFFNILNLKCLISSPPVLSSDLHPAPWFRAFK